MARSAKGLLDPCSYVLLDDIQRDRRQELTIRQHVQPFAGASDAGELLHMVVPGRDVGIADGPVDADAFLGVGFEIQIAVAIALARPDQRAPADLIAAVRVVRQHMSYVSSGPFQPAIAAGLRLGDEYFEGLAAQMDAGRQLLGDGLARLGLDVVPTAGSYFLVTDATALGWPDGAAFVDHIVHNAGVVAIPVERLSSGGAGVELVRWTFCKRPEVLQEALRRLAATDLRGPVVKR